MCGIHGGLATLLFDIRLVYFNDLSSSRTDLYSFYYRLHILILCFYRLLIFSGLINTIPPSNVSIGNITVSIAAV